MCADQIEWYATNKMHQYICFLPDNGIEIGLDCFVKSEHKVSYIEVQKGGEH
jgi:hypothetical protein